MTNDEHAPPYSHDYGIMANNIFHVLCELDQEDREHNRSPAWHDITILANRLRAYTDRVDVLAETILQDERGFIERDPKTTNVRLTQLGRQNCDNRI
jgi:hypothetical protein